jgi:hypothetical protein
MTYFTLKKCPECKGEAGWHNGDCRIGRSLFDINNHIASLVYDIEQLKKENLALKTILADCDPQKYTGLSIVCVACGATMYNPNKEREEHKPDCLWVRAHEA